MLVKACVGNLINEIKLFGKDFKGYTDEDVADDNVKENIAPAPTSHSENVTEFTAKKGRAASKIVKKEYQFQIMQTLGIPTEEIHLFADPAHWLEFFPPLCQRDLTNFGARIDWRRSLVTTDANQYYDAFVRWQMNRLQELKKIKFGKRSAIYSPTDGQPCIDHDRSEGERIDPQEYTTLKLKVLEWATNAKRPSRAKSLKAQTSSLFQQFFDQRPCTVKRASSALK